MKSIEILEKILKILRRDGHAGNVPRELIDEYVNSEYDEFSARWPADEDYSECEKWKADFFETTDRMAYVRKLLFGRE